KALYKDIQSIESETQLEDGCEDSESPDEAIEVGDRIYAATLHPPPTAAEIQASQTPSQHLAQAFVANSQPKPLHSTVPHHLQNFED
ncbi:hypothetical protein C0995_011366, partial [Termitomyces sp. Mi166